MLIFDRNEGNIMKVKKNYNFQGMQYIYFFFNPFPNNKF